MNTHQPFQEHTTCVYAAIGDHPLLREASLDLIPGDFNNAFSRLIVTVPWRTTFHGSISLMKKKVCSGFFDRKKQQTSCAHSASGEFEKPSRRRKLWDFTARQANKLQKTKLLWEKGLQHSDQTVHIWVGEYVTPLFWNKKIPHVFPSSILHWKHIFSTTWQSSCRICVITPVKACWLETNL